MSARPGDQPGDGHYRFCVHAASTADPTTVFAVLADAEHWSEWAGPFVARSSWEGTGRGEVGSVRQLGRFPVIAREQVVVNEPPERYAYVQLSGVPARTYRADVSLEPRLHGGTWVEWCGDLEPSIRGTGPMLRLFLSRTVSAFARRLAVAAEHRTVG